MTEQKTPRYASVHLRVSTNDQDNANQETGILHYASLHGYTIDETYRDTASTRTPWRQRGIHEHLSSMKAGTTLLVAEISRLARSTLEVLEIAAFAADRNITIIATKNSLTLNGSLESKITTTILGLAAEIEREFIRARTTEALARAKNEGRKLGRPVGRTSANKLDGRESEILRYIEKRLPKASMAKLLDCSRGTLDTKLARLRAQQADKLTGQLPGL